jgi:hypothetical protein
MERLMRSVKGRDFVMCLTALFCLLAWCVENDLVEKEMTSSADTSYENE